MGEAEIVHFAGSGSVKRARKCPEVQAVAIERERERASFWSIPLLGFFFFLLNLYHCS